MSKCSSAQGCICLHFCSEITRSRSCSLLSSTQKCSFNEWQISKLPRSPPLYLQKFPCSLPQHKPRMLHYFFNLISADSCICKKKREKINCRTHGGQRQGFKQSVHSQIKRILWGISARRGWLVSLHDVSGRYKWQTISRLNTKPGQNLEIAFVKLPPGSWGGGAPGLKIM